ncbi:hypothetical protein HZ326_13127 [Fusarium oxysporum f. sp. albedinis]|nr:hypothetical protein HZ326_13127 [Fusarium oxysporum f. sp. albedinis]
MERSLHFIYCLLRSSCFLHLRTLHGMGCGESRPRPFGFQHEWPWLLFHISNSYTFAWIAMPVHRRHRKKHFERCHCN